MRNQQSPSREARPTAQESLCALGNNHGKCSGNNLNDKLFCKRKLFSVSAPSVLRTRKTIAAWTKAEADELTARVMELDTAAEVKALLEREAR